MATITPNALRGKAYFGEKTFGHLLLDGDSDYADTSDKAALDITGDFEVIACVAADDWISGTNRWIINKFNGGASTRSYAFGLSSTDRPQLGISDGTTTIFPTALDGISSTGIEDGDHLWLRATFDADNGSSGNDASFWWSTDPIDTAPGDVTWTSFGTNPRTTSGAVTMPTTTETLEIGRYNTTGGYWDGKIYGVWLYDGIGGTLVADPDFRSGDITDDSSGNTWAKQGTAAFSTQPKLGVVDFVEDFNVADSTTLPSPWQEDGNTQSDAEISSNRLLLTYVSTSGAWVTAWPQDGTRYEYSDVDITVDYEGGANNGTDTNFGILLRIVDPASAWDGYGFKMNNRAGVRRMDVVRLDADIETVLGAASGEYIPDQDPALLRFRIEGNRLKAKWWDAAATEPDAWHIETTDSTYSAAGAIMLDAYRDGGAGEVYFDDFTVTDLTQPVPDVGVVVTATSSPGATITPTALAPTSLIPQPSISTTSGITISPTALAASGLIPQPSIFSVTTLTVGALAANAIIAEPSFQYGQTISPSATAATTTIAQPIITAGTGQAINPTALLPTSFIPTLTIGSLAILRPRANVTTGSWSAVGATNLWEAVELDDDAYATPS